MSKALQHRYEAFIAHHLTQLQAITEEQSTRATREGAWNVKQILGHLIDSSVNNHNRFVRGALEGHYEGPGYQQNGWVDLHGYATMTWAELIEQWEVRNRLIARVVGNVPEEKLAGICRIGDYEPMSLEGIIVDYLDHARHHFGQISEAVEK